jgi:hypothetical protein
MISSVPTLSPMCHQRLTIVTVSPKGGGFLFFEILNVEIRLFSKGSLSLEETKSGVTHISPFPTVNTDEEFERPECRVR